MLTILLCSGSELLQYSTSLFFPEKKSLLLSSCGLAGRKKLEFSYKSRKYAATLCVEREKEEKMQNCLDIGTFLHDSGTLN